MIKFEFDYRRGVEKMKHEIIASTHISNCAGIGIVEIDRDYIKSVLIVGDKMYKLTKSEIRYDEGDNAYFMKNRAKWYLSEFMINC